ncbi:MAG: N-acetylneuraminate synthase family protein [bacterium]|nr:N-acetylneuraminate synthase family protein [bacterium]
MEIKIVNKIIGKNQPVFIVAELGLNHNGSINLAKKMILAAKRAGADAVKMQSFITEDFVGDKISTYTYKSRGQKETEVQYKMFKRCELNQKEQKLLFDYAKKNDVILFSSPQDNSFKTVDYLCSREINMPAIKVGSDDLTNLPMLEYYAKMRKPMIISTGMASLSEVRSAVRVIKKAGNNKIIILKCTSLYPTSPQEANLNQIKTLQKVFSDCLVGFSDHTEGLSAAVVATAMGAVLIEKHFTLNHNFAGPDHWFAADPKELSVLVHQVRQAEKILGNSQIVLSKEEKKIRDIARRSVIAALAIKKGQKITAKDLEIKRPGTGLPPEYLPRIAGKIAKKNYNQGYIFTKLDL